MPTHVVFLLSGTSQGFLARRNIPVLIERSLPTGPPCKQTTDVLDDMAYNLQLYDDIAVE